MNTIMTQKQIFWLYQVTQWMEKNSDRGRGSWKWQGGDQCGGGHGTFKTLQAYVNQLYFGQAVKRAVLLKGLHEEELLDSSTFTLSADNRSQAMAFCSQSFCGMRYFSTGDSRMAFKHNRLRLLAGILEKNETIVELAQISKQITV